jgi:Fe-S-cluster containining protein
MVSMSDGRDYDCQTCGACCLYQGSGKGTAYIFLQGDEPERMKRLGLPVVHVGRDCYLGARNRGGHPICIAFRGRVGGSCGCSIYSDRPDVCRQFEVGDPLCIEARERAGLPV